MKSILAGFMIGIGAIINLTLGGIAGALFFSLGLFTIITFQFELFTGKAGLYAVNEIKIVKLIEIWIGNFIGTFAAAIMILMTPQGYGLADSASKIVSTRLGNHPVQNLILGIFCGLLMFIAVEGYAKTKNVLFVIAPVAVFILSGFNHCVADMFYSHMGIMKLTDYHTLLPTTIGNFIGCNMINFCRNYQWRD